MAEYTHPTFLNHHHHYPIDIIYIKNKEKYPPAYFLMDNCGPSSTSGEKIDTISHYHRHNKRKQQEFQSPNKKRIRPIDHHHHHHHQQHQQYGGDTNDLQRLIQLQDTLDYLHDEWATINIVLQSLKTAFTTHPTRMATEDHLDNIDRELSIGCDDLMAQIRSLNRSLKRLEMKIKSWSPA